MAVIERCNQPQHPANRHYPHHTTFYRGNVRLVTLPRPTFLPEVISVLSHMIEHFTTTDLPIAAYLVTKLDMTPQISWDSERKRATFSFKCNPQKIEGIVDLYFQGGEVPASKLIGALSHLKTLLHASRGQVCAYQEDKYDRTEYNRGRVR